MSLAATAASPAARSAGQNVIAEAFRREPLYANATLLLLALIPPTLVALTLDTRTLHGVSVWMKPLKFEVALAAYLATLAWFAGWLPSGTTRQRWYRVFSAAVVVAIAAEMIWIIGASAYGIASHFNVSSPIMQAAYGLMGVFAIVLTSSTLVYGVLILRDRNSPLANPFRWSLGASLILTFVLTLGFAGYMSSSGGQLVGMPALPDQTAPFFGWSRTAGDLRVPHFFATHAMHVIPLAGFIAVRLAPPRTAWALVTTATALFLAFVVFTFWQALSGRPFLPGLI